MNYKKNNQGQSLIEVLLAIAIFGILIAGSVSLSLHYFSNIMRAQELLQADKIVNNTFEAVQSISYNDWNDLTNGNHGLTNTNGYWEFNGTSDQINNKYTRTITISSLERDDNDCSFVESGGTTDPDTKQVDLNLVWQSSQINIEKNFTQYFTNWKNPTFCLAEEEEPGPSGQAGSLGLEIGGASRQEYLQWLNLLVTIDGVEITNESDETVVVDKAQVFMDEPSMDIYGFYIDDSKRWGWFGPGSPGGTQASGTTLDISNYTIDPGETVTIRMTFFTGSSGEITFSINFIMEDSTEVETDEFTL